MKLPKASHFPIIRPATEIKLSNAASCPAITDKDRLDWLANNGGGFAHDEEDRGISTSAWGEWACKKITPAEFRVALDVVIQKQNAKDHTSP